MPKKNDFIIVGGGLVGCLASLILSKKNYTICLVEKKIFKHTISDDFTPLSLTINTIQFLKKNNSTLRSNSLLLVDAAAEYDNYASDITRTIPVSGKFNEFQKKIYEAVLKAQTMAIKACKPGKTLIDIHNVAVKFILRD